MFVVSARGGAARFVIGGPANAFAWDPDWSPDGRRLVFLRSSNRGGRQGSDLFTVSIAGTELRRVTSTRAASAPAWSPDGRTIAFSNNGRLALVPARGGVPRLLDGDEPLRYCSGVDWSPDGRRLAAQCSGRLVVVDRDGANPRVLATDIGSSVAPAWSPDGKRIVFESAERLEIVPVGGGPATVIDLRGAKGTNPGW